MHVSFIGRNTFVYWMMFSLQIEHEDEEQIRLKHRQRNIGLSYLSRSERASSLKIFKIPIAQYWDFPIYRLRVLNFIHLKYK